MLPPLPPCPSHQDGNRSEDTPGISGQLSSHRNPWHRKSILWCTGKVCSLFTHVLYRLRTLLGWEGEIFKSSPPEIPALNGIRDWNPGTQCPQPWGGPCYKNPLIEDVFVVFLNDTQCLSEAKADALASLFCLQRPSAGLVREMVWPSENSPELKSTCSKMRPHN